MISNIKVFENNEFGQIKVLEINNEVWFVGKEVAEILGYSNTRAALGNHVDKEDKATVAIHDGRQNRNQVVINESGLYSLVLSSQLPKARNFKRWVTSEVLVSIRKHGMYATDYLLNNPDLLIAAATKLKEERSKRIEAEEKVKVLSPAAEFGTAIGNCKDAILIRDFAKVLANSDIKIGQERLFSWLHTNGYIYRDKGSKQWMAYKKYVDMELFKIRESKVSTNNHGDKLFFTVKITGKGQRYFYEKIKSWCTISGNATYKVL